MRDTPTQKQSTSRAKSRWSDYISDLACVADTYGLYMNEK